MTHERPLVFIASSVEGLPVAAAIKETLFHDADCCLWNDPGVFEVSETTTASLQKALQLFRFAIVVLTPDDVAVVRGRVSPVPRANLLFELGLFAGRHGLDSAYMVLPHEQALDLPSDLLGVTTAHYKPARPPLGCDVGAACAKVLRAMRAVRERAGAIETAPAAGFWNALRETVYVVFGVEPASTPAAHPRLSLRDLDAAQEIAAFLARGYPRKRVRLLPASASELRHLLMSQPEADLVLVGGFAHNAEYGHYRLAAARQHRLKIGRLCRLPDQHVYHPAFAPLPAGVAEPSRAVPESIERLPSEYIARDYALVSSSEEHFYGALRRVVGVAGIKGNGTRGAAQCLTQLQSGGAAARACFGQPLHAGDTLEAVVETRLEQGVIDRTEVVEARLNGAPLLAGESRSEPCELRRACAGCDFGEAAPPEAAARAAPLLGVRALVFDLDDTLIDTFEALIAPLESAAALALCRADPGLPPPGEVARLLLDLRRRAPARLESELRRLLPRLDEAALQVRRLQLAGLEPGRLAPSPDARALLERLHGRCRLLLLTAGDARLQQAKIASADIGRFFDEVAIVEDDQGESKARALEAFVARGGWPAREVAVVGNRLDQEIAVGARLGLRTVWLRRGEGAGLEPDTEGVRPEFTLSDVSQLGALLF